MKYRTGIGYDVHRLATGRPLVLGGVIIPHEQGLLGHSDADVVLHAIGDALLGAAGLGDLGELFPNTDPAYRDADSRALLREICRRVEAAGWRPVSVDTMIVAEAPRLADWKPAMRRSVAQVLGLPAEAVSIKAGTNEGLDAIGRGEAIGCWASVLITRAGG